MDRRYRPRGPAPTGPRHTPLAFGEVQCSLRTSTRPPAPLPASTTVLMTVCGCRGSVWAEPVTVRPNPFTLEGLGLAGDLPVAACDNRAQARLLMGYSISLSRNHRGVEVA